MAPKNTKGTTTAEKKHLVASTKPNKTPGPHFSYQNTTAAPNAECSSQYAFTGRPDDLAHLAFTHYQDNTHIGYYSNTLHVQDHYQEDNHYAHPEHQDLTLDQDNTLPSLYTYSQVSHILPSNTFSSSQQHSTTQTPLQRWMLETPLESPWDAVASYRPFSASSGQGQAQDFSLELEGQAVVNGEERRRAQGNGDDAWSVAGTWGSGDGFEGAKMMRT